jgi:hypothetical protein
MNNSRVWIEVSKVLAVVTVTLVVLLIVVPSASAAAKYKLLYRFTGHTDGGYLDAGVILDSSGNLYGTTCFGGFWGGGTVFELTPNSDGTWTQTTIYSFNADSPYAPLVFDAAGNLYGTTYHGGDYGVGSVFMLTANSDGTWTETTLYSFAGGKDGAQPVAGLILDAAGNLYGTTNHGGRGKCQFYSGRGCGTVFKLTHDPINKPDGTWTESVLHAFAGGMDGGFPDHSNLVFDAAGNLYGAARSQGIPGCDGTGCGTVFELTPKSDGRWNEAILHRFNGKTDGGNPNGTLVFDSTGQLYGTTLDGGHDGMGNVFKLTLGSDGKWKEQVIHEFTGGEDGGNPYAGVIFDAADNLYGATDGALGDHGTIYKLSPRSGGVWKETILHQFGGRDGGPRGDVVFDQNGNLYDTTDGHSFRGVVFEITP